MSKIKKTSSQQAPEQFLRINIDCVIKDNLVATFTLFHFKEGANTSLLRRNTYDLVECISKIFRDEDMYSRVSIMTRKSANLKNTQVSWRLFKNGIELNCHHDSKDADMDTTFFPDKPVWYNADPNPSKVNMTFIAYVMTYGNGNIGKTRIPTYQFKALQDLAIEKLNLKEWA